MLSSGTVSMGSVEARSMHDSCEADLGHQRNWRMTFHRFPTLRDPTEPMRPFRGALAGVLERHCFVFSLQEIWAGVGRLDQILGDHVGFPSQVQRKSRCRLLNFWCSACFNFGVLLCFIIIYDLSLNSIPDSWSCLHSNFLLSGVANVKVCLSQQDLWDAWSAMRTCSEANRDRAPHCCLQYWCSVCGISKFEPFHLLSLVMWNAGMGLFLALYKRAAAFFV